jgi:hypothetical protein
MGLELKLKAVLVSVAAAACVSCTSELKVGEGNMDLTITVGGDSLMLPLGSTESMGISDFLDLDSVDFLYVDEYGNYYLEMTDTFEEEVAVSDFAESMTVEGIDRNFDDRDFTVYSDATGIGADFDFEEEFTYLFSFQDAKDSGLVSISYVNLENTYLLPRVHLEADKTIPESMVVSLEVIVPEKYVFEDVPAVNGTTVTFEGNVSSSGDVNFQPVMMESIELNLGENDPFEFEDVFTVNNLSISVDQAEMTEFEGAVLSVSSRVTFGGDDGMLHPSSFYGKVDIRLDEIEEQILLDEIPEYLKGEEVKLDFISPYATVSLMTNSGVPIIIDADIVPVFESGDSQTKPIGLSLSAPVSDDETVTETANYWLASETPSELPSGYQWMEADVRNLLSRIPDRLDISVRPYSDLNNDEDHYIDCNAVYDFSGEMSFVLPFEFGDSLYVPVRDTLADMPEELGTALTTADIMLNGTVVSSFPVSLQLSGDFLNGNYEPLGIKIPKQTIGAGGTDGEPVSSQLSIKVPQSPRAEEIAYLVFQFELLNGTGASISESSTIQITDISAGIPGGLTLDLNQE